MDGDALVRLVKSFLDPAMTAGLILIPTVGFVYCIVEAIKFFASGGSTDPQDRTSIENKIKRALFIMIILFSLTAILKIFGISV